MDMVKWHLYLGSTVVNLRWGTTSEPLQAKLTKPLGFPDRKGRTVQPEGLHVNEELQKQRKRKK